ncbi:sugar transferase [Microbacterium sp. G2-8]|uniref:sugar transferase n=1 Tax=Microbacterium sp. G2-8 TaxID=2842454 RepID=UPI001C89B10D|nr:sugar transferase [Microbacterium sp. G2-8]
MTTGALTRRTATFEAAPFIALPYARDLTARRAKRLVDVSLAGAALVVIAALLPVIAIAIAIDSPGPVFFRQLRVGQDGRLFAMWKFRTMRADAEIARAEMRGDDQGAGPLFKLHDDPRVTRVGRLLRRHSIDELPQFWNVLMGAMSIVGPRPPLREEVLAYEAGAFRRLDVKPGITGPWQVSGRSDLTWEESLRLDLRYVETWSLPTDLALICRTVGVVVRPKGAY